MTIPAKRIVQVNPGVQLAGGNPLALNGLFLTENPLMPVGKVFNFVSTTAVKNWFGAASDEYALSLIYFAGYNNSTIKPTGMLFAAYNAAARAGYLQSASLAGMSLTQLKALSGILTVSQDGVNKTSTNIVLTAATSFSDAATIIEDAFTSGPAVTFNPIASAFIFTSPTTGANSAISFATGTLAAPLSLTQATGAVTSAGTAGDTPSSALDNATNITQNFATIVPMFEPVIADKQAFAVWSNAQGNEYEVIIWDTDTEAVVQGSTTCFGAIAKLAAYNGVSIISGDNDFAVAQGTTLATLARNCAAFVSGMWASVNFNQLNGRITSAFRSSGSITATVDDDQLSQNLIANGYNYYGNYATRGAQNFIFFYPGQVPGEWEWMDPYMNQIFLNSQFQAALLTLLTSVGAVAYNPDGYGLIRNSMQDPINQALNNGTIRTGVTLSAQQLAEVNQAAGQDISSPLQTLGYFLQILDPGAQVRGNRGTPVINFWYTDGGAIQQITLASIDIF